jgi:hypothetical protein
LAANVQGHTWNSLDLIETLVRLGDHESADVKLCVREMLDKAVKISAELVHMGLLQVSVCFITHCRFPSGLLDVTETLELHTNGLRNQASRHVPSRAP